MDILLKGKGICEHCGEPVVIFQSVDITPDDPDHPVRRGRQVVCDSQRYFLLMDGVAPESEDQNRLVGIDTLTGALVYGRRATAQEREEYRETKKFGVPYTIVVRPHHALRLGPFGRWVPGCIAGTIIPMRMPLRGAEPCQEQPEAVAQGPTKQKQIQQLLSL